MLKFFKSRSKVTVKVTSSKFMVPLERSCHKDHICQIYLSKVLTERFSIVYKTQTKEDIRFYILTLVLVDIN